MKAWPVCHTFISIFIYLKLYEVIFEVLENTFLKQLFYVFDCFVSYSLPFQYKFQTKENKD